MDEVIQVGSFRDQFCIWPYLVSLSPLGMVISNTSWRSLQMTYRLGIITHDSYITRSWSDMNYLVK